MKKKICLFISKTRTGIFIRNREQNCDHAAEGGSLSGIWAQVLALSLGLQIILGKLALGNLSVVSQFLNQPMPKKCFRNSQVCLHEWQDQEETERSQEMKEYLIRICNSLFCNMRIGAFPEGLR